MSDRVRAVWLRTPGAGDPAFSALLTGSSSFDDLPDVTARITDGGLPALCHTIAYALDDDPDLAGTNTTTEALARVIADRLALRIRDGALGPGGDGLEALTVTLRESPVASASYDRLR